MNDHCDICALHSDKDLILETDYWRVYLSWNQDRLGRCLIVCKEHKRSLIELSPDELSDWTQILHRLHPALYQAFKPTHINVACLMNGAFKDDSPQPHVHWWSIPRYDREVTFEGEMFKDSNYPAIVCDHEGHEKKVNDDMRERIIQTIQEKLR
jgi:ATP adenylyltransferase